MKQRKILSTIFVYLMLFVFIAYNVQAAPNVPLGTAGNFTILAQSTITDAALSTISGNIGLSPAAGSFIFVTCEEMLNGRIYTVDATYVGSGNTSCVSPGPGENKTFVDNAVLDMGTAYTNATGWATEVTDPGTGGDIGGLTLAPAVYTFTGAVTISTNVILNGSSTDVWIFQIPGTLGISSATNVTLIGGAQAENVFWAVAGTTTLGTTSVFNGNILGAGAVIALQTGATLNGRALSQVAVTLDANNVSSGTINISTDSTAPVVNLVSPANNTWSANTTPQFTFNQTDADDVNTLCTLFVGAGAFGTNSSVSNNTDSTMIANASLSQGNNEWYVNCTDGASNVGSSSIRTILVDSINPSSIINNINGVSNGFGTNDTTLIINFSANDTNIINWTLSLYDAQSILLQNWTETTNNISATETYNTSVNGTYYVNLTVRDNATNINTTSFTVYVDQSAPVINSISTTNVTSTSAILIVNASDAFSEINNCTYSNVGDGNLTFNGTVYTANVTGLNSSTIYTVNITCFDRSVYSGSNTSTFTTASITAQAAVNLATAGNFVILAKSGISTTGTTAIVGDIGVSPIAATAITGFGLILDPSNQFATSSLITGNVYAADYADPTPAMMTTAISDMETAYTDAAGRTSPDYSELGSGNIGGMTLAPGLYTWSSGVTIPADVTLFGNATDVWIFQVAGTLDMSTDADIILSGGARAQNIFWAVADVTTLGTTSVFNGNILEAGSVIALQTGATLNGRALSQFAVTLDGNSVSLPIATSLIAPTTAVINPGSSWVNTSFNVTLNATGFNGTAVSYINYTLNNVSGNINSSFGEVLINNTGNNTFTYYAVDVLNNVESLKTIYALLDTTAPNITSFNLSASSVFVGTTITGTCNATDDLDPNATIAITGIDTTTAGVKNATCTATDLAGNNATISAIYTVSEVPQTQNGGGGGGGGSGGSGIGGGSAARRGRMSSSAVTVQEGEENIKTVLTASTTVPGKEITEPGAESTGTTEESIEIISQPSNEAPLMLKDQETNKSKLKKALGVVAIMTTILTAVVAGSAFYFRKKGRTKFN